MNLKKPLVSVITPSFNHANYIEEAVKSVINQTYGNIEHIIIDDGSTDASHQVLRDLKQKYPQLIIKLHKENKGHARINEGVSLAKGEYISILSSDDWYLPEKISMQVDRFLSLQQDYGVVYSAGYRYYEDTKEFIEPKTNKSMVRGSILKELLTEPFFIYPISPLIKKKCLIEYPFLPGLKAEGEAIYFRIAMKYKFDFVDEPLVVMRDHSRNTGKDIYSMLSDNIAIRELLFSHPDFPADLLTLRKSILSKIYFLKGWEMIRLKKDYNTGIQNMNKAVQLNPSLGINPRFVVGTILAASAKLFGTKSEDNRSIPNPN